MHVLASLSLAVCMLVTGVHVGQKVASQSTACWISGDLVGDSNPADVQRALCGSTGGDQTLTLE
jgi:hypothetical protein